MKATAVIGACYGDEGKGHMVDYLAATPRTHPALVVRFNGGAQAGHTVVTPDGRRHAFSHIGSGTFAGAATYLSRSFLINPLLWLKEREELAIQPSMLYVDPTALFTTPWDMLVNREIERQRASARHGSCGYGINETVTRSMTLPSHIGKAESPIWLRDFLRVARNYSEERFKAEGGEFSKSFSATFWSEALLEDFMDATRLFCKAVSAFTSSFPSRYDTVIFEGAQGLLLDEQYEFFPHVTRSRTGLTNVVTLCRTNGIEQLEVIYVMRAYMTRHGAGPFPTEIPTWSFADETNAPNEFQGTLRFGTLDIPRVAAAIRKDLSDDRIALVEIHPSLAVTCLDQVGIGEEPRLRAALAEAMDLAIVYRSYGPTRDDIHVGVLSGTAEVTA